MCMTLSLGSVNELKKSYDKIYHNFFCCVSIYWKCQESNDGEANLMKLVWFFYRSGDDIGPEPRAKRWYVH